MSLHLRTLQDTCAVYGLCSGCFDGSRTFVIANHRSKLAAYTFSGESETTGITPVVEQVALLPTYSRHVHHCECVWHAPKQRHLLLVLFVDVKSKAHTWMLLYWHDKCSAFVELNTVTSEEVSFKHSTAPSTNVEGQDPRGGDLRLKFNIVCSKPATFTNQRRRRRDDSNANGNANGNGKEKEKRKRKESSTLATFDVHLLSYTVVEGMLYTLIVETETEKNNNEDPCQGMRNQETLGHMEKPVMRILQVANHQATRTLLQPMHIRDSNLQSENVRPSLARDTWSLDIVSLELMKFQGGFGGKGKLELLVAVLCRCYDAPVEVTDLHCLKLTLQYSSLIPPVEETTPESSSASSLSSSLSSLWPPAILQSGPWTLRNIDPTTVCTCLCRTEEKSGKEELVILSSQNITRMSIAAGNNDCSGAISKQQTGTRRVSSPIHLNGIPTCLSFVKKRNLLICGDTGGGLHLVFLGKERATQVTMDMRDEDAKGSPPIPSAVQCVLNPSEDDPSIFHFIAGSRYGSSRVWDIPANQLKWCESEKQPNTREKTLIPVTRVTRLVEHSGPVVDCCVARDTGLGEEDVLISCRGFAEQTTLSKSSFGCSLEVFLEAKGVTFPEMGIPCLISVPYQEKHFLFFSFEALQITHVLRMSQNAFHPCTIAGLNHQASTLAASSPCDGFLVQVTKDEIRLVDLREGEGDLHASTKAEDFASGAGKTFEHAAVFGNKMATASKSMVQGFQVRNSKIHSVNRVNLENDISCLQLKEMEVGCDDITLVLVGQWHSNSVTVMEFHSMDELLYIDTFTSQPRSVAISSCENMSFLYVGSNDGLVCCCPISTEEGALCIEVEEMDSIKIGNSAVSFTEVWVQEQEVVSGARKTCPCMYAHSDVDVVFKEGLCSSVLRHLSEESMIEGDHDSILKVEANRVAGSENITSIAALRSPVIGDGVVWLDSEQCLRMGQLKGEAFVQTKMLRMKRSVTKLAYHEDSKSILAISEDEQGRHWLDVVDARTMEQKTGSRLHENHFHTALSVERIPSVETGSNSNHLLEVVVTGSVAMKEGGMKENSFCAMTAFSVMSFYTLKMLPARQEGESRRDREIQLLGTYPIDDICNCVKTVQTGKSGKGLLLVGCNESLILLDVKYTDKGSTTVLEEINTQMKILENVPYHCLSTTESGNATSAAESLRESGKDKHIDFVPPKAAARKAPRVEGNSSLIEVRCLTRRDVKHAITNMISLSSACHAREEEEEEEEEIAKAKEAQHACEKKGEVACSDANGFIVVYSITTGETKGDTTCKDENSSSEKTGEKSLEWSIEPATCFLCDGLVHTMACLLPGVLMCSDSQHLFVLERRAKEEADFEERFREACARAYEAGDCAPLRSVGAEMDTGRDRQRLFGGAALPENNENDEANANINDVEPGLDQTSSEDQQRMVVPCMKLCGGCKTGGAIVSISNGMLKVNSTEKQEILRRDVLNKSSRKVCVTSDGQIICLDVLKREARDKLLKLQRMFERGFCFGKQKTDGGHNDTFTNICLNHKQLWDLPICEMDNHHPHENHAHAHTDTTLIDGDFILSFLEQLCSNKNKSPTASEHLFDQRLLSLPSSSSSSSIKLHELADALRVLSLAHT